MTERATRYGLLTRLRVRVPGLIDQPADVCPLPYPSGDWTALVLSLPDEDHQPLRLALRRLLATQTACGPDYEWTPGVDAPWEWFTVLVADNQESGSTAWDLWVHPWTTAQSHLDVATTQRLREVVPREALERWETQPPLPPYGGCQSITIRRDHLDMLCYLVQQTRLGQLRAGYRRLIDNRQYEQEARTRARQLAHAQLSALADIHEQLAAAQIEYRLSNGPQSDRKTTDTSTRPLRCSHLSRIYRTSRRLGRD